MRKQVIQELVEKMGNRCAFPNCNIEFVREDGLFGDICHITALSPGGQRYTSENAVENQIFIENLLLLCPNHHRLVDAYAEIYTTEWLKETKRNHEVRISEAASMSDLTQIKIEPKIEKTSIRDAITIWERNSTNAEEEFWQRLFKVNPFLISLIVPGCVVKFGEKCYVGGKSIHNQGGNLVDFIYSNHLTKNVVLVEIKTPCTKLVGGAYRNNAYSLTEELSGAIVQVLTYKDELLKNYNSLCHDISEHFNAFNPKCLIIAGNLQSEKLNSTQTKSFELYRANSDVEVITYDELFNKIKIVANLIH
ncbi:Shedu anti-phage system protein SduA domain-containing protein [Paenibacillus alvei]|uniref:Shedu protein SduA C-terminal domain-containing protein n=1 Tax=Paenibacillus alvei TaxID=44250 RepID=A0A383RK81_PAEAL|nr:Shedu anti-phage system protein SduA domain-containing protein [Paenibacillus alvei]SYX86914.1 conserved protein of unknown function [Paenibacillus alvei]